MPMNLPLLDLEAQHAAIRKDLDSAISRVLEHGQFVQGPEVVEFEDAFAAYSEVAHCIGAANGTAAIELVLRAAGIGRGDEVITTPFTFIATVEPILLSGAQPVFVDVNPETALLEVREVEAAISPRTAAIMPVHLYGQTVDLDAFRALADRHNLFLIEDAAQAHGARWKRRRAGSVGDAATFSFFPGKNLGALGDAGAVTTNDQELAAKIRKLRDHGRADKYRHDELGTNARLDTLQAAVLAVKLPHLDSWNDARRRHAMAYDAAFTSIDGVEPIRVHEPAQAVYHQYVVRIAERDQARAALIAQGIGAAVHYPIPLHLQPALAEIVSGAFPVAETLSSEVLSVPVFPEMKEEQRASVVRGLSAFVRGKQATAASARA
jgi:dTDP-4-amino-4,6-dideoxygalactose transaminase